MQSWHTRIHFQYELLRSYLENIILTAEGMFMFLSRYYNQSSSRDIVWDNLQQLASYVDYIFNDNDSTFIVLKISELRRCSPDNFIYSEHEEAWNEIISRSKKLLSQLPPKIL